MILFGTNPIAWSNDDDWSIGDHISLDECLDDCRSIGFDGIEKGHKMPSDGTELKAVLAGYGLKFVGGWHSLNILAPGATLESEMAAMDVHIDMTRKAGSDVIIVCECSNTVHGNDEAAANDRPTMSDAQWERFMETVNALASHATRQGLRFCYHHHTGTVIESADDIDRFMAAAGPDTLLLLDTGHCTVGGADPAEIARKYMDRVGHIHCKNIRPAFLERLREDRLSFLEAVRQGIFTVPGDPEGMVAFEPVLTAAAEAGYSGWIVIEAEQDSAVRNPLHYQRMGLEALKDAARRVGLVPA
ncbi:myo-inosose-2 dehydratase [Fulvimarina sp. 2208YS6-2-32]|uniref:Myo-inosose-2 dehydratase n=1 Tax=Fulvimarina uroteuthidis TaxID=3098149 RepID=A0ABU5I2H3_9HYPH|nr:myo-inosose-2 dehydratase [Fulvimarina sp. 2208YS6-2-32]MDY8109173.1 myo-inosose-2 dehydratase [Fulvimarina sp. 2208YS6-2-32]